MGSVPRRMLVFDGDCPLCVRVSRLARWGFLVGEATARPHDAFVGAEADRLAAAGVRNEMAVLDPSTGEIRSGYDGILWLLRGGRLPWLAALLAWPPVRWLLRHEYRLVAYNRRILAPPRRLADCACDPDLHRGYRWAFIVAALLWTGLFGAVAGVAFWTEHAVWGDVPVRPGGAAGTAWTGPLLLAGWGLTGTVALRLPSPRGLDYLGHLAWTYAALVLPLLAAVFLVLGGLLVSRVGLLPGGWASATGLPASIGAVAWALALPIAVGSCLGRLPRLGLTRAAACGVGLAAWLIPSVSMALLLPVPFLAF